MPDSRDHRYTIRFKPDECAEIVAKAGSEPVASFLRGLILERLAKRRKLRVRSPAAQDEALATILARLPKFGSVQAFNSVADSIADGTLPTSDTVEAKLDAIGRDIADLKRALLAALRVSDR